MESLRSLGGACPADLALQLAALERGRANGGVDPNQILDYIAEIKEAVTQTDLEPWRIRGTASLLASAVCCAGWLLAGTGWPELGETHAAGLDGVLLLGVLFLAAGACCLRVYARRRQVFLNWFRGLEQTVQKGGAILEYLKEESRAYPA